MIAPSFGAATLVQPPCAAGVPKSGDLVMSMLDYDEGGHVTVTGKATPGAMVHAYINDKMVAEGRAAADGSWRLVPAKPVGSGKYALRLDRLAKDGKPVARLELPFERIPAPPAADNSERLVVVRGDSLWNIAREHCAHTLRQRFTPHYLHRFGVPRPERKHPPLRAPTRVSGAVTCRLGVGPPQAVTVGRRPRSPLLAA
jgi:hypothetical protein